MIPPALPLLAWAPVTLLLFLALPPRRALIASVIGGWLFLPMAGISFQGVPPYTKYAAIAVPALLCVCFFDARRVSQFRAHWIDLPILLFCVMPVPTAIIAQLGAYEGFSHLWSQFMVWGTFYLFGRIYFTDEAAMKDLAIGLVLGALVYVPLCLFEIRMAPMLAMWIYGDIPSRFVHHMRFGGFRPVVFMQSGLMTGFFMGMATLVGLWMYRTGAIRKLWGVDLLVPLGVLVLTTVLSKAIAAIAFTLAGIAALWSVRHAWGRIAIWMLVILPVVYVGARAANVWQADEVGRVVAVVEPSRAASATFRFEHEAMMVERIHQRPITGWGRFGDWRVRDDRGRDQSVSDSLWVITFGQNGLIGLVPLMAMLLLPSALLLRRCPKQWWYHPQTAPVAALTMVPLLFTADCLLNAMVNPIWTLIIGGLGAYYLVSVRGIGRSAVASGGVDLPQGAPERGRTAAHRQRLPGSTVPPPRRGGATPPVRR